MGTLHDVYQIKPRVLNGGALLKVKLFKTKPSAQLDFEDAFIEDYFKKVKLYSLVLQKADPHLKVYGMYQEDRIIENPEAGHYFLVQSGSKWGFGKEFEDFLQKYAKDLEDALFYVGYADRAYTYEIRGDQILMDYKDIGTKTFTDYILDVFREEKEILADLYFEELLTVYNYCQEMKENGDTLDWYYDHEDYEQFRMYLQYIKDPVWKTKFRACFIEILKY